MRLLREDLSFAEYYESPPPYAILSHTWGDKEFTHDQLTKWPSPESRKGHFKNHRGHRKISKFVKTASRDGYKHFWADNCCIDSRNSADLTESINSMFRFYENAACCYVYLDDFEWPSDVSRNGSRSRVDDDQWIQSFVNCRWFTRSWTLQELLAPRKIEFFDKNWIRFSSHVAQDTLLCAIEARTHIPGSILQHKKPLGSVNVATKMFWAARRQCKKPEDMAYSLLGIFNVNMPLIYGEGREKAFQRLQKEIVANTTDESIFAWSSKGSYLGLLAKSPDWFQDCSKLSKVRAIGDVVWTSLNTGLYVELCMVEDSRDYMVQFTVYLNVVNPDTGLCPSFQLYQIGDKEFVRSGSLEPKKFPIATAISLRRQVLVRQSPNVGVPKIMFDCSQIPKSLAKWDGHWPSVAPWDMGDTHTTCEHPVRTGAGYMVILKVTHIDSGLEYLVAVTIDWEAQSGRWKCSLRIQNREISWRRPSEVEAQVTSEGMATYRCVGYHCIIETMVPRWIDWHFDGCIRIPVTVKPRKNETGNGGQAYTNVDCNDTSGVPRLQPAPGTTRDHDGLVEMMRKMYVQKKGKEGDELQK